MLMFVKEGEVKDTEGYQLVMNMDLTRVHLGLKGEVWGDPTTLDESYEKVNRTKALRNSKGTETVKLVRELGTSKSELNPYLFKLMAEDEGLDKQKFISNLEAGTYESKQDTEVHEIEDNPFKTEPIEVEFEEGGDEEGDYNADLENENLFGIPSSFHREEETVEEDIPETIKPEDLDLEFEEDMLDVNDTFEDEKEGITEILETSKSEISSEEDNGYLTKEETEFLVGLDDASKLGEKEETERNLELSIVRMMKFLEEGQDSKEDLANILLNLEGYNKDAIVEIQSVKALLESFNQDTVNTEEIKDIVKDLLHNGEEKLTANLSDNDYQSITDMVRDVVKGEFEEFGSKQPMVEEPVNNITKKELTSQEFIKISQYSHSKELKGFIEQSSKQNKLSVDIKSLKTNENTKGIHSIETSLPLIQDLVEGEDNVEFLQFLAMHFPYTLIEYDEFRRDKDE